MLELRLLGLRTILPNQRNNHDERNQKRSPTAWSHSGLLLGAWPTFSSPGPYKSTASRIPPSRRRGKVSYFLNYFHTPAQPHHAPPQHDHCMKTKSPAQSPPASATQQRRPSASSADARLNRSCLHKPGSASLRRPSPPQPPNA